MFNPSAYKAPVKVPRRVNTLNKAALHGKRVALWAKDRLAYTETFTYKDLRFNLDIYWQGRIEHTSKNRVRRYTGYCYTVMITQPALIAYMKKQCLALDGLPSLVKVGNGYGGLIGAGAWMRIEAPRKHSYARRASELRRAITLAVDASSQHI